MLEANLELILLLLRYKFKLDEEQFAILRAHLTPKINDDSEHGWEELVYASMTNLLRTCLAKSAKDTSASQTTIKPLGDLNKLKKHITIVFDRLSKGGVISL